MALQDKIFKGFNLLIKNKKKGSLTGQKHNKVQVYKC